MTDYDIFDVLYDDELTDAETTLSGGARVTPEDAFVLSINRFGRVDLGFMAASSGCSRDELIAALEGVLIWKDPNRYDPADPYEAWLAREQYVRGNIYRRLDEVREKEARTGGYAHNIALLQSALPAGPDRDDIVVTLGATWVPEEVYSRFVCDLMDMSPRSLSLHFDAYFGRWYLKIVGPFHSQIRNTRLYGTPYITAMQIIEHTMNAAPIRVTETYWDGTKKKTRLNYAETMAAQQKQERILREFQGWLAENTAERIRLRKVYLDRFGYRVPHYDGAFLELPGMNPEVCLYPHQRSAAARIILSQDNVLLSHDVGAGKTYAFLTGVHERLRMGLSRKAMLVVPNSVFEATVAAIRYLYPGEEFTPISTRAFSTKNRESVLKSIRDAEQGFFVMAASSFDMIGMTRHFYLHRNLAEIERCTRELRATVDYDRRERMKARIRALQRDREKIQDREEQFTDCFDELGIDLLVVDECHNYKNILKSGRMDRITGFSATPSRKALQMLDKCDFVRERGGKLVFATGTPLTNCMVELYVLMRYLQPNELKLLHVDRIEEWVTTFCSKHTHFEIDTTGVSFRYVTRFDSFHNLPELMAVFGNVCDFYKIDPETLQLPEFHGYENVSVPLSHEQAEYIQGIVERTEAIRNGRVRRTEDNYLSITNDGRKAALDIRLVEPYLIGSDTPAGAKAAAAVSAIRRIYDLYPGMTQVVFCDLSVPCAGWNLYDEVRRLLVEAGIPRDEIAFIHDAATSAAAEKLIRRFNAGEVRVLLGSTQKLGLGVNIQERLAAIHHLDMPFRPSDLIQREGRGIRQGNMNKEVLIFRYVTEKSFDAYMWQILEGKARFLMSFLSGTMNPLQRSAQDIDDMELDYAEIKALAIGNPLIKERVETSNRIARMRMNAARRREELSAYRKALSDLPAQRTRLIAQIQTVSKDRRYVRNHQRALSKDARETLGGKVLSALTSSLHADPEKARPALVAWYHGFGIIVPPNQDPAHPHILLSRGTEYSYRVEMKDAKAGGCCTRIDNVLKGLPQREEQLRGRLAGLNTAINDAQKQIDLGNPFEKEMRQLEETLKRIDDKLAKELNA